jgi:hypothetical protein
MFALLLSLKLMRIFWPALEKWQVKELRMVCIPSSLLSDLGGIRRSRPLDQMPWGS